jgi:DNA-binding NarL/FixJ family response regulator
MIHERPSENLKERFVTDEAEAHHVFPQLTPRRVDVLRGLASGHSESGLVFYDGTGRISLRRYACLV